jgi:hypothetical protein
LTKPDYDKELELELKKGYTYWKNDITRRPDSKGHRKGKGRLKYAWDKISNVIKIVLQKYESEGIELTLRKLNYLLIALKVIPGLKKTYDALGKHMTEGREVGRYEPNCIVDERHPIEDIDDTYSSPEELIDHHIDRIRNITKWYHKDDSYFPRWYGQKNYVEIWTEKVAAVGRLIDIKNKNNLQVRIVPFGGFPSFASLHDSVVKRLKTKIDLGKNIHILYLGDFDPSGEKIDETTKRRLSHIWHVDSYAKRHNVIFKLHRIAITKQQIIDYELPWDPEKTGEDEQEKLFNNPNYKSMKLRHGQVYACGLDAFEILRLKEYENTIVDSVNQYFDKNRYDIHLKRHKKDYSEEYINGVRWNRIKEFAEELRK